MRMVARDHNDTLRRQPAHRTSTRVEASLLHLNEDFKLAFIDDLVAQKTAEHVAVELDWPFHGARLAELETMLDEAFESSALPEKADRAAVSDFLVQLRLGEHR